MAEKKGKGSGKKKEEENKEEFEQLGGGEWGDDDENFGLPDIEYSPLDRDSGEQSMGSEAEAAEEKEVPSKEPAKEKPESPARKVVSKKSKAKKEEINFKDDDGSADLEDDETTAEDFELEYDEVTHDAPIVKRDEEKRSMGPIIVTLIVLVVIIGAALGWIFYFAPKQAEAKYTTAMNEGNEALAGGLYDQAIAAFGRAKDLKPAESEPDDMIAKANQAKQAALQKKREEDEAAAAAAEAARLKAEAEAEAAKGPAPGTVEVLTERTGKYYVVIASSVDEDLAMDYANRVSKNGVGLQILSPQGKLIYHRVTIASRDTFDEAQAQADQLKAEYSNAWAVKY